MLEQLRRKPFLAGVAVASAVVLLVVVLLPISGPLSHSRTSTPPAQAKGNGKQSKAVRGMTPSAGVLTTWSNSTVLVSWKAMAGATAYQLTLIRLTSDFTPDILKVICHRPGYFGAPYSAAVQSALRGPSAWTVGERELFAAFVSRQNECRF